MTTPIDPEAEIPVEEITTATEPPLVLHDSRRERGTHWLFGKPYHWGTVGDTLTLLAGPDPREMARAADHAEATR